MIIDHVGYFLYPDNLILRAIGRLSFPIFFLLIGRNGSPRIGSDLIRWAIVVQGTMRWASYRGSYNLRQLNILPTAILVKLIIHGLKQTWQTITTIIWRRIRKTINTSTYWLWNIALDTVTNQIPWGKNIIEQTQYRSQWIVLGTIWFIAGVLLLLWCIISIPWTHTRVEYGSMSLGTALLWWLIRTYKSWRIVLWIPVVLGIRWLVRINHDFPFPDSWRQLIIIAWFITFFIIRRLSYHNQSIKWWSTRNKVILWFSASSVRLYVIHFLLLFGVMMVLH